jgi:hypothetical protein
MHWLTHRFGGQIPQFGDLPVCNSSAAVISTKLNAVTDVTPIMQQVDCAALGSLLIASAESVE